jgi:predicted DNA-binding transcriptional regulator AlpA
MSTYLDIQELAAMLGQSARTIMRNLAHRPKLVLPKMHIPGSLMLRWRAHDVQCWMYQVGWPGPSSDSPTHNSSQKRLQMRKTGYLRSLPTFQLPFSTESPFTHSHRACYPRFLVRITVLNQRGIYVNETRLLD